MKRWKSDFRSSSRLGWRVRLLVCIGAMVAGILLAEAHIRPMVESMLVHQAKVACFRMINTAILETLESDSLAYSDIIRISRAADGTVTSLETDMQAVNRLKAKTSGRVAASLEKMEEQTIMLPLGTMFGSQLTTGRGPAVTITVVPVGYVQSELYNQFTAAGINQTLHQIMMKTSVQVIAIFPGYRVETDVVSTFCIAETVIVGQIPDGYTVVGEDNRGIVSKINDYGAQKNGGE